MLDFFRHRAASWGIKIILGLIIVAFAFWGTGRIRSGREQVVAEVGKEAISLMEFDRAFRRALEGLERMTGRPLEAQQVKELGVAQRVLSNLVNTRLLLREARQWGLRPWPGEVRETILRSPLFERDGRFDRDLYFAFLRQRGMTPADFEAELAHELMVGKVQRAILSGVHFDEEEARRILSVLAEGLVFEAVRVPVGAFKGEVEASDEELLRYYTDHQEEFRVPERVTFAYAVCDPHGVLEEVSLDPREVERYYEENPQEFTLPERVRLAHIFVKEREKAQEAMERLGAGEDFAKVASDLSEDPLSKEKGGDLGYLPLSDLREEFSRALSEMKVGEYRLFETEEGFHILKLLGKRPEEVIPFEKVKAELAERVRFQKAQDLCAMKMADLAYRAKKGGGLKASAEEMGMEVKVAGPVAASEEIKGLGPRPRVIEAAFSLPQGEVSQVIEDGGEFFVVEPLERIPSRIPSFDEVKEEVRRKVLEEKARERAREVARMILEAWREGKEPKEIYARYNLKEESVGPLSRIEAAYYWSKDMALLSPSDPIPPEPLEIQGGFVALKLKEVQGAGEVPAEEFAEGLEKAWQSHLLSSLLNAMAEREGVKVNPKLLGPYGFRAEGE